MNEFTGFETAPDRSIWPALVDAADLPRLQRLLEEARLMMGTLRPGTSQEAGHLQTPDIDWSDLAKVIEGEEDRRRILLQHTTPVEFTPRLGEIVTALGQVGDFEVTDIDPDLRSVDLKLVNYEFRARNVPWFALQHAKAA